MLTLGLSFVDLVDSAPVVGAPVTVTVDVAPRFLNREGLPEEPTREEIEEHLVADLSLAERVRAGAVTDREGRARVQLDVDDAWREVGTRRPHGHTARDVVAFVTSRASLRAIDLFSGHRVLVARSPSESVEAIVVIDPAKLVIGCTTATSTRVRYQLHAGPRPDHRFLLVLRDGDGDVVERRPVATDGVGRSGVVQFDGLRPSTTYDVRLVADNTSTRTATTLATGEARTAASDPSRWTIGFASCHLPTNAASMRPWRRAAARDSADLLVLLGDQIYGWLTRPRSRPQRAEPRRIVVPADPADS